MTFSVIQRAAYAAAAAEEQLKADFMEELYVASGRTNGLYTGLWDELKRKCMDNMANTMAESVMQSWAKNRKRT